MGVPEYITDKLKKIISQTSGKLENSEDELIPRYKINGFGVLYCLSTDNRTFIKVNRGIEIYVVEHNYNNLGKDLIYTYYGDIILIDPDEIEPIGFD
tara:strand:+ start:571 stop:861 length:291 start_codon:yes stop_codon:yes gene_type:complete